MAHQMTAARRSALRKAQLASARKRRKNTVGSSAKRAVRQRAGYAKASVAVRARKSLPGSKSKKSRARKVMKHTAYGLGGAAVVVAAARKNDIRFEGGRHDDTRTRAAKVGRYGALAKGKKRYVAVSRIPKNRKRR